MSPINVLDMACNVSRQAAKLVTAKPQDAQVVGGLGVRAEPFK